jgi:feruloyl esterase
MNGRQSRLIVKPGRGALLGGAMLAVVLGGGFAALAQDKTGSRILEPERSAACSALVGRSIGGAHVDRVDIVAAGQKGGRNLFGSSKAIVPFCRVHAIGSSGEGSSIKMEVLLPAAWNGKLIGVGGGGLSGGLSGATGALMRELARGYAGVANDAGHTDAKNASWGIGSPARIDDFGYRANHVAAIAGKAIAAAYYARPVERSYFSGCSNGGRDALMLAQRFPDDYDGIVAGAPAINWTGLMAAAQVNYRLYKTTPGAEKLPSKLAMVRAAVMAKCDRLDGVADDVLENPLACRFDPGELQCEPGKSSNSCLTPGEVAVVRAIYRGPRTQDGTVVLQGYPLGSEHGRAIIPIVGWGPWFLNGFKAGVGLSTDFYRGLVTQNLAWDPAAFDLERDYRLAKARVGGAVDALDPDLRPFAARGGKLVLFQGWEDAAIPAGSTLDYYAAVAERLGAASPDSVRLFMAPGMAHCSLGHGPDTFDVIPVIDAWVSSGQAPATILAEKREGQLGLLFGKPGKTVRTRPLCPWPATARYTGSGSTDEAKNFTCAAQGRSSAGAGPSPRT